MESDILVQNYILCHIYDPHKRDDLRKKIESLILSNFLCNSMKKNRSEFIKVTN